MPSDYIVNHIAAFLAERYPAPAGVKVLDISCGDGKLVRKLRGLGFDAKGTNWGTGMFPHDEKHEDIPVDYGIDVLKGLPYEDASFDAVVNSELLEHLESHRRALSEMGRIVKPGGYFVFETPNIFRMASRLQFFLTGFHKVRNKHVPFNLTQDYAPRYHNFPIHLPFVHWLLFVTGFRLRKICWNKTRIFSVLLGLLFYPFVLPSLFYFLFIKEDLLKAKGGNKELWRVMASPAVLMSSVLILAYQKENT